MAAGVREKPAAKTLYPPPISRVPNALSTTSPSPEQRVIPETVRYSALRVLRRRSARSASSIGDSCGLFPDRRDPAPRRSRRNDFNRTKSICSAFSDDLKLLFEGR